MRLKIVRDFDWQPQSPLLKCVMQHSSELLLVAKNPASRQILANVGNRYVVFGPKHVLPGQRILGPNDVPHRFSHRVGDEYEFPIERLLQSVYVEGAEVKQAAEPDLGWDMEVIYPDHSKSLVQIKVGTRDFVGRDYERNLHLLREIAKLDRGTPELWTFNIERLRLNCSVLTGELPKHYALDPLNVWEFGSDGSTFDRAYVVGRVSDWEKRIEDIYIKVEQWSAELDASVDKTRTVLMSEELMQKFAVPDREIPILDLNRHGTSVMSFVPVGLWMLGSNGLIDIISRNGTAHLLDEAPFPQPPAWSVIDTEKARKPWTRELFLKMLEI